ncbi:MAG: TraU family protein [Alteromonadaceae bacterium]|nr:TraU family protein [Alteromonadaceae bacterium]
MNIKYFINLSFIISIFLTSYITSAGSCNTSPINPITDVSWQSMFPISIGGIVEYGNSNMENVDEDPNSPVCSCSVGGIPKFGLSASFWEPARIIDTVSTPYCMMPIGSEIGNKMQGKLGGSYQHHNGGSKLFQQLHYYIFPVLAILDMYTDLPCIEYDREFDVAMLTEVLPSWNDDLMAMIINPEAILFANPAAALACAADSASVISLGKPINSLYWCMGSWGMSYPLAGSITATDYVEGNAALAARGIYLMGRTGLLQEFSANGCSRYYAPIWNKDRYRLQMVRPVVESHAKYIGSPGILWTQNKHPVVGKDNFEWLIFRKVNCCVSAF